MPIRLPRLNNPYLRGMAACGRMRSDSAAVERFFSASVTDLFTERSSDEGPMILRVFWANTTIKHLHVDYVKKSEYGDMSIIESSHASLETIEQVLESLFGEQIDVKFYGRFTIPRKRLPRHGLVSNVPVEAGSGLMSVSMISCEYEITGAPFDRFGWEIIDEELVAIEVGVSATVTINETYIVDRYEAVEMGFDSFLQD